MPDPASYTKQMKTIHDALKPIAAAVKAQRPVTVQEFAALHMPLRDGAGMIVSDIPGTVRPDAGDPTPDPSSSS